jgi:hypothetical protein
MTQERLCCISLQRNLLQGTALLTHLLWCDLALPPQKQQQMRGERTVKRSCTQSSAQRAKLWAQRPRAAGFGRLPPPAESVGCANGARSRTLAHLFAHYSKQTTQQLLT